MGIKKFICMEFQPRYCPFKLESYKEEVIETAAEHLIDVHEYDDTLMLRDEIRSMLQKEENYAGD